jgi:tight adherence protein C
MIGIIQNTFAAVMAAGAQLAQVNAGSVETPDMAPAQTFWQMIDAWDVILSVLILADVAMLIYSIFGQSAQARLSPQREAALATGHTDRKTVFESGVIKHLMWLLLTFTYRMNLPRVKAWVRAKLVAAGNPEYYTPEEYLALALASGTLLGLLLETCFLAVMRSFSVMIFLAGLGVGIVMTVFQLYNRADKRIRLISKRVPYSLDLISLAMGAGATFTEAALTVVREETDDPFNIELKTMLAEMDLGTTRRKALRNLADRIPLDSLRSIVASVIQAEELGTPLGEILHQQASLLRLHRSVRAENAAAVASVRILVPSLLILIAVVIAIFGPAILRIIERGLF